jgi:hypothetical protein
LFVAALKSSEKIVIDEVVNDKIKETMLCLLAALLVSDKEFSRLFKIDFSLDKDRLHTDEREFLDAWKNLKSASDSLIKELKKRNDSKD